ncbi:MAG: hypothetical protein DRH57_03750 [Candidatus Cloacimonadota bacterium]|nr:MAG: hypothetical protein DRH57_03750 [Candidatus Cloacimonadota bacterium]
MERKLYTAIKSAKVNKVQEFIKGNEYLFLDSWCEDRDNRDVTVFDFKGEQNNQVRITEARLKTIFGLKG